VLAAVLTSALSAPAYAADAPPDLDTVKRSPSARTIPLAPRLRFEPRADMTAEELDRLGPYLKGKPLHDEDRKTLGPAMRHLREVD
jgi:hypothetical protein